MAGNAHTPGIGLTPTTRTGTHPDQQHQARTMAGSTSSKEHEATASAPDSTGRAVEWHDARRDARGGSDPSGLLPPGVHLFGLQKVGWSAEGHLQVGWPACRRWVGLQKVKLQKVCWLAEGRLACRR